ncbi:hypothetical protein ACOMHN_039460 [Nucella lapillus]
MPLICSCMHILWFSLLGTSLVNLLLISLDRFCAICLPFHYSKYVSMKAVLYACVIAWVSMTLLAFLPLFGWNKWNSCKKPNRCDIRQVFDIKFTYVLFGVLIGTVVLNTCLMIAVIRVATRQISIIRSQRNAFRQRSLGGEQLERFTKTAFRRQSRVVHHDAQKAVIMFVVFALFLLCWLPYIIGFTLKVVADISTDKVAVLMNMGICIASFNACLNAGVYGCKKQEFRAAFRQLLCRKRPSSSVTTMANIPSFYISSVNISQELTSITLQTITIENQIDILGE